VKRHLGSRAMLCCVNGPVTILAFILRTVEHGRWESNPVLTTLVIVLLLFAAYLLLRYHEK
jgi:hypothetical protein